MSDLAGLDIGWSAETSKRLTIREILCEEGRRGQKTGAGFYDYDEARNAKPSAHVETVIREFAKSKGVEQRAIGDAEILERCIYPMINEGAKILEEGKAQRASDIDIIWIYGYGWPVYRGGPMFYADTVGLKTVLSKLKEFQVEIRQRLQAGGAIGEAGAEGGAFTSVMRSRPSSGASRHLLPGEKGEPKTGRSLMREAVIVSTARTPIGKAYRGAFNDTQAQTLGGHVISTPKRASVEGGEVDDVVMGAALQQGRRDSTCQTVALARRASDQRRRHVGRPAMRLRSDGDRDRRKGDRRRQHEHHHRRRPRVDSLVQNDKMNRTRGQDPWLVGIKATST